MAASARFDDLGGRTSFGLEGFGAELVARAPGEVAAVLTAAEQAARDGGWVAGWVAYEAAAGLDPALAVCTRESDDPLGDVPLAWFGVFDRRVEVQPGRAASSKWVLDTTAEAHRDAVGSIRARIAEGMTYQVNLTARAHAWVDDPAALYHGLIEAQGGAHNALLVTPTHTVACASPELFFAVDGTRIVARPMKGTARRGRWPDEDDAVAAGLRASAKERAENVMIVDLIRNDIGRIAEYGSVVVPSLFDTERYPTMWQLTSTVEGGLRVGATLAGVFTALFPSGSVTGAPKRAAMQLVTELEERPRGVYCGAVGWCAPGPSLRASFAVAIRTATTNLASGYTEYGAGGGITWGSAPDAEWRELAAKTGILDGAPVVDALFETMASDGPNTAAHLARLGASAQYFGFGDARLTPPVAPPGRRVRLTLRRDGEVGVEEGPMPPGTPGPVRLAWCEEKVDSTDVLRFHKTTDRAGLDRRRASRPDADDVVLVNERDEVTETTIANLAVRIGDRWWTPALKCGLLPGVERARLLDEGVIAERVIGRDELGPGVALAVLNSLRGWRDAVLLE